MITIVCVKVGTKYGSEYVNKLASMVRRHTTLPYNFVCLTDDACDIYCQTIPIATSRPGWWAKLEVFVHPVLAGQRVLYIDLDTVIVANIDKLLLYDGRFAIIKDWWARGYNSSVMNFEPHTWEYVSKKWTPEVMQMMHGDQDWITQKVASDLWQNVAPGVIGSYKADQLEDGPRDFALICFHGDPKPHTFSKGWVYDNWR